MSEAAEQLEAMATMAEIDKGDVMALIQKMDTQTSGKMDGARGAIELSIMKSAKECSVVQFNQSSLPLHPTSIKLESGCMPEPKNKLANPAI